MAKLFSFEEQGVDQSVTDVELGSSAEEGAAAQVLQDVTDDHQDLAAGSEAVQTAMDSADQLSEVRDSVKAVVDNGEGLTPISAEGYRLAVETIAMSVGYPKKSVYTLYSAENFSSAFSSISNTQISLEGIGEFLKNLWERIKAAVKNIIQKVKAFYAKHLSGLGRVVKALESIKKKIGETKGSVKESRIKLPTHLATIFPIKGNLSCQIVEGFLKTHEEDTKKVVTDKYKDIVQGAEFISGGTVEDFADSAVDDKDISDMLGSFAKALASASTNESPFVGGKWIKIEAHLSGGDPEVLVTTETSNITTGSDALLIVASKSELSNIVSKTVKLVSDTKGFEKAIEIFEKNFSEQTKKIDKILLEMEVAKQGRAATPGTSSVYAGKGKRKHVVTHGTPADPGSPDYVPDAEVNRKAAKAMNAVGRFGTLAVTQSTALTSHNVKAAFAVVGFVKYCLAQYK